MKPDRLSYLVAAHVLMATPDVQLCDRGAAARIVATIAGSVHKRMVRLRGWRAAT